MIEKAKITAYQFGILLFPMVIATAIIGIPAISGKLAKNDMIFSPIWASLNGFLCAFMGYKLQTYYPNQTLIQYSERILGKFAGKSVGLLYLLFLFHLVGIIVREYTDVVVGFFLQNTPMVAIESSMILVCAFAVRAGIEVIARCAMVFLPVFILPLLIMYVLAGADLRPANMLPLFEHGITPSLLGATAPQAWFGEVSVAFAMLPYLTDAKRGFKAASVSILGMLVTLVVTNMATLMLLGNLTSHFVLPVLVFSRYIRVFDFVEHLESLIMAVWITGIFIKISLFYYMTTLGTAQWFRLADYRILVFPVGWLIVLIAIWSSPNSMYISHWIATIFPFYGAVFFTLFPACLLIVTIVRNKWGNQKGRAGS
jgi:spore germination protein KB